MSEKGSNIKSKLPSRHVSVGPKSAPHRSMYYAMGLTEEEIYQPFIGVQLLGMNLLLAILRLGGRRRQ